MAYPRIKLADNSGNEVAVTSNALDVNIAGGATIDIGDVDMFLDGGTAVLGGAGAVASGVLRVTLASDDAHFGAVGTGAQYDGTIHAQLAHIGNQVSGIDSDTGFIKTNTSNASTYLGLLVNVTKTFGTSTYTETSTYGNAIAAVRNDDLATLADTDNEFAPLQVNENGALYVTSGADHSGTVVANGTQIMAEAKTIDGSTLPNIVAEGDAGRIAASRAGIQYVCLTDAGGTEETLDNVIGTSGSAGPTKCISMGATEVGGNISELTIASGSLKIAGTVDLGSTDNAVLDAIAASLEILDDWDDSNYANVNINIAGTDVDGNSGNKSAQSQRVVIATDDVNVSAIKTAVEILDNAISGSEMQVDVVAALPAGTNAIGKLAANDGVDIGDVSVNNLGAWLTSTTGTGTSPAHVGAESYVGSDTGLGILAVCSTTLGALTGVGDGEYTQLQVNTDGALYVEIDGGVDHNITGMVSGKNTGVDDTTAEVIVASAACKRIDMQASPSNTGDIWVGGSNVAVNQGIRLQPGDFYSIDIDNTDDVYVKATVDEEDIHFTYYT